MSKLTILASCLVILLLTGCGKFTVVNDPASGIDKAPKVCIIKDPETREGFLQAMQSWLNKEGIANEVLMPGATSSDCEWVLRYYGKWSWDLALFLADAEITAFHDGKQVGRENLVVGQWDAHKFEKGEDRIHKMMDMLFSKVDHYVMPQTKNPKINEKGRKAISVTFEQKYSNHHRYLHGDSFVDRSSFVALTYGLWVVAPLQRLLILSRFTETHLVVRARLGSTSLALHPNSHGKRQDSYSLCNGSQPRLLFRHVFRRSATGVERRLCRS